EKEKEDKTDPFDPCDLILAHQNCSPSSDWKKSDCDGDGVTNEKEKEDKTDPFDPCDLILAHQNCSPSSDWKKSDCDGDGVTNEKEKEDKTDPFDPCDLILAHQNCSPSLEWKKSDCDGDGVPNGKEKDDKTDPLDPCSYNPASITLPQTGAYLTADCDGDGVPNETEGEDGTDPLDPCEFVLAHQTVPTTVDWNELDCDGDGVPNDKEKEDGTDPLDPCSYNPESVTLPPSAEWESLDCDNDGNPNVTDPDPLVATARDDFGSTPAMTEVVIDILTNDDYLPNNDPTNLGVTSLAIIGGTAIGSVSMDADTGLLTYIPIASESNSSVTLVYQVCNTSPDPSVCASATVTIEIGANTLDAMDDDFSGTTDGGTIPGSNVMSNDTLNGVPVGPGDVVLTSVPTDELTINEDGSITITPGTPEGTYTMEYTICEVTDPANCDSATVTVTVGPGSGTGGNTLDAVDDDFSGTTDGGTIPGSNVLSNDTLNGVPVGPDDVVLTSVPTDELTINEDGGITITPGTPEGTYTIEYTICEVADPANCDSATVSVVVEEGDGEEKIEVNQLVTPNGDGKNDFLFIRGVENAKNNTLQIFNRWGVAVYKGNGYNNQNNIFDGRSKGRSTVAGSDYLPAGVYYYIFQYENKQRNITDSGYIYVSK
ncbi:MAG TPA: gliding motility-associated C-terminal domain-containing protein, partial [Arenibacter sp.]|nr:gliding motility-associated C-terminal domain-containing protein [Arenibacter sp.]